MQDAITALILTFNEAPNIERTLRQLGWVEQILIVDSFSTDGTVDLARDAVPNAAVVKRQFDTHAAQWNFGLDQVTTPWVLSLDADYELSPELVQEIQAIEPTENVVGYSAEFQYRVYGVPLRASVYPPRVVLFRKSAGRYYDDGHTQKLNVKGNIQKLSGLIYHDDRKPLSRWIQSQDRYATMEARHLLQSRKQKLSIQDRLRLKIFFAAPVMFLYLLFGRGLILDGWRGWAYVCQRTIAELLLSVRLLMEREKLE
jgi:glycosyltransferase involved in cell wall biosynthesis